MIVGLNLLYLLPGVVGGTETYAAGLLHGLAAAYGHTAERIDVVPEAPSPGLSGPDPMPPEAPDAGTGPYLLAFGGVTPNKNLERLLRAYALASERHGLTQRLVLVGHVPASVGAERTAGVVTTGYLDEATLARWLTHADALVFPSLYEGFGLPVLEAMAAGVPVVCSAVTAIPEVAGDSAVYFDPRDTGDMAGKIALVGRPGPAGRSPGSPALRVPR